jgi:hypothetical protein
LIIGPLQTSKGKVNEMGSQRGALYNLCSWGIESSH